MGTPKEVLGWLYERAQKKSDYELDLSNVLDVKGGILLAVITLFASDPLRVFAGLKDMPGPKILEIMFGVALCSAAILAVCELWPRKYRSDLQPTENEAWITELANHYEEYRGEGISVGDAVKDQLIVAMLERLRDRVPANRALNRSKIWCLSWSFRLAVASMLVYVISALALKGA